MAQHVIENVRAGFKYDRLENARDIRLVGFSNVVGHAEMDPERLPELEIIHVSLDNLPKDYFAFSYAWLDPTPKCRIVCNGEELLIAENAYNALLSVYCNIQKFSTSQHRLVETLLLWIDTLSINQADYAEKSIQVPLMSAIYRKCKGVFAYIGAPTRGGEPTAGIRALAWLGNSPIVRPPESIPQDQSDPRFQEWYNSVKGSLSTAPLSATFKSDLEQLMENSWFSRSWVVQELILSNAVECFYGRGQETVSWPLSTMSLLIKQASSRSSYQRNIFETSGQLNYFSMTNLAQVDSWAQLRESFTDGGNVLDPVTLMKFCRDTQASDKRDKVYAALSLMNPEIARKIPVDYSPEHTVRDVFEDFAKSIVSTNSAGRLLEHAGLARTIFGLPTWVPDWSFTSAVPMLSNLYKATLNIAPVAHLVGENRKLSVRGFKIDTLAGISYPMTYTDSIVEVGDNVVSPKDVAVYTLVLSAAMMCTQIIKSGKNGGSYAKGENWFDVLWRTLTMDRTWDQKRNYENEREHFHAFIRAHNLEDEIFSRLVPEELAEVLCPGAKQQTQQIQFGDPKTREKWLPFSVVALDSSKGRVVGASHGGLFGLFPREAQEGDVVALLFGSNVPFLVRPTDSTDYELVGPCYVHGIMDGEAITACLRMQKDQGDKLLCNVIVLR